MNPTLQLTRVPKAIAQWTRRLGASRGTTPLAGPIAGSGDLGPAFDCFSAGQWDRAFEHLTALADAGNGDASRIALMLEAHGPRVFGKRFAVALTQRQRWSQAPAPAPDQE
jgi:hypothetical protein